MSSTRPSFPVSRCEPAGSASGRGQGFTVKFAVSETPAYAAVIVTNCGPPALVAVMVRSGKELSPAGAVTLAGTVAMLGTGTPQGDHRARNPCRSRVGNLIGRPAAMPEHIHKGMAPWAWDRTTSDRSRCASSRRPEDSAGCSGRLRGSKRSLFNSGN